MVQYEPADLAARVRSHIEKHLNVGIECVAPKSVLEMFLLTEGGCFQEMR